MAKPSDPRFSQLTDEELEQDLGNMARCVVDRAGKGLLDKPLTDRAACLGEGDKTAGVVLVIETDGSMLSTRESGWKEAKVGMIFRQSALE